MNSGGEKIMRKNEIKVLIKEIVPKIIGAEQFSQKRKCGISYNILKTNEDLSMVNFERKFNIHINVLVQLLYGVFKKIDFQKSLIVPTIVILDSLTVTNVTEPGVYIVDFEGEQMVRIDDVKNLEREKNHNASLAIGYAIQLNNLVHVSPDDIDMRIEEELMYMIHRMNELLNIHGELTCDFEENTIKESGLYHYNLSAIFLYQWIINK